LAAASAHGSVQQHAVACGNVQHGGMATATCGSSPIVVVVVGRWRGRRRKAELWRRWGDHFALFCDELTNLRWLTLSILKYLSKTKLFILESA
jgi:hypothetical protein